MKKITKAPKFLDQVINCELVASTYSHGGCPQICSLRHPHLPKIAAGCPLTYLLTTVFFLRVVDAHHSKQQQSLLAMRNKQTIWNVYIILHRPM